MFFDPFESGVNTSYPERIVELPLLPRVDCVVLSHRHFDHFDVRTLAALDRNVVVFYPDGEDLIESVLSELGFARRKPLKPWSRARAGALEIIATPSLVSWPELGIVVRDGVTMLWSLIDTVVDRQIIATLREHIGDIDCLLAQYSPILQYELRDSLGARALDVDEHGWLFDIVRLTEPQVVVPSAGGLRFCGADWQNSYGFPVSPVRFLSDLTAAMPGVQGVLLEPGDVLRRGDKSWDTEHQSAVFVSTSPSFDGYRLWQHDPGVGTPPFADGNPLGSPQQEAYEFAAGYITGRLIDDLRDPANAEALAMWQKWCVRWRLDLYRPGGLDGSPAATWWLDFAADDLKLAEEGTGEVDVRTAVTATGIYDLLTGRCSSYAYLFGDRTRHTARVFEVTPDGVGVPDPDLPEPLLQALTVPRDLDALYVKTELRKWGQANH